MVPSIDPTRYLIFSS